MPEESVLDLLKRVEAHAKAKTKQVHVTKKFLHEFNTVAEHYGCSPEEIDLMRESVRMDTENAIVTFHNLHVELGIQQDRRKKPRNDELKTSVSGLWTYTDKI